MVGHALKPQETLESASKKFEITASWSMIFAFVVVVFGMLEGMFGKLSDLAA